MRKNFVFFCLFVLLPSKVAQAYDACIDEIFYNFSGTEAIVTYKNYGSNSYTGSVTIPSLVSYNGQTYTVSSIGEDAFNWSGKSLTSVTIANNITSIGKNAFKNCYGLTSITIPKNVMSIGSDAFSGCSGLTKAEYSSIEDIFKIDFSTQKSNPLYYSHHLYIDGEEVKTLVIPNDVLEIDKKRFYGVSGFHTLIIGSSVKTISSNAFTNDSIIKTIWLPNDPPTGRSSAKGAINYCSSSNYNSDGDNGYIIYPLLTSIFETNGLVYVPTSGTECDVIDCNYLGDDAPLDIGSTVTYRNRTMQIRNIMPYACYKDNCIQGNVTISNNGYVGEYAFYGCTGIGTLSISNNGYIGEYAFKDCNISPSATIENKGDILQYAFYHAKGNYAATINNTGSLGKLAFGGNQMSSLNINNKVTSIGEGCFSGSTILQQASINNSGDIGKSAFYNAKGGFQAYIKNDGQLMESCFKESVISSVEIGTKVTSLGNYCFADATGFTEIVLPNNITQMGTYAFQNCTTMENITLSRGLNQIAEGVFSGCSVLSSMLVPNSIQSIGNYSFDNCPSLRDFTFEDKNGTYVLGTSGQNPLFATCGLSTVYIGGKLQYTHSNIPYSPFYNHPSLFLVIYGNDEIQIYDKEFENCIHLNSIYMGTGIESVGDYAFKGCTSLSKVDVGPAVEPLGNYSFEGCSSLKTIDLANTVEIKSHAFSGCNSLSLIRIPSTTTNIENAVFEQCIALKDLIIEDRTSTLSLGCNKIVTGTVASEGYKKLPGTGFPLFADCPLDSVYIGGPISYNDSQEYGYSPFFFNESLRTAFITQNETTVYENEFYNCVGLQRVTLGRGVREIEQYGFHDCTGLEYFEFASSLESIGREAFSDCSSITQIISHASIPPVCGEQALEDISIWDCTLYVPEGSEEAYQLADQWKNFFIIQMTAATSITLNVNTLNFSEIGDTSNLIATVAPTDVWDGSVTWSSNNTNVATVDSNGTVTAVGFGTAIITATTNDGTNLSASCQVTVSDIISATGISLNNTTLSFTEAGQTATLTATITPESATNKSVTWTSSNTAVATVSNNGLVTAVANGSATITATTNDGSNLSAICNVVVSIRDPNIIVFADTTVKQICVANWDTDRDGELSLEEAATVTELGTVFKDNTEITSFNELQYFIGLTSIEESAFSGCYNLQSIIIPCAVTNIGNSIFYRCFELSNIVVASGNTKYDSRGNCNAIIETASNKLIAGCQSTVVKNTVTSIGDYAFTGSNLTWGIELPNSIVSIGSHAFYRCGDLLSLIIPSSVVSIGESAFEFCSFLSSITIPNSVTSIGNKAFAASGLNSITIPNSVSSIGDQTFLNCTYLATVTIPNSVTLIGYRAFEGCTRLTDITIPSSVTSISGLAFNNCTDLTSVTVESATPASINNTSDNNSFPTRANIRLYVPEGSVAAYTAATDWEGFLSIIDSSIENIVFADAAVKQICVENWDTNHDGELSTDEAAAVTDLGGVFGYNEEITSFDELQYFTGLTSIGEYDFFWCPSLRSVIIPDNVTSLSDGFTGTGMFTDAPDGVFYVDKWACAYKGDVTPRIISIAEGTRGIANRAFNSLSYSNLTTVRIPNSVEYIGDYSFRECSSLKSLTLGSSVKSIGNYAFEKCSQLAELFIPSSVSSIGTCAFKECLLTSISVDPDNATYDSRNDCNAIIETVTNTLIVGCRNSTIPATVTGIGDYAFYNCFALDIAIPNSVTSIGDYAFYDCQSLNTAMPNSVTTIGNWAFSYCYSLTDLTIPNTATTIGDYSFQSCSSLTSVSIGSSVTSIGNYAFNGCSMLRSVSVSMKVPISIESNVFPNRANATLYVPSGKKSVYEAAEYWKEFKEIVEMAAKPGDANGDGEVTIADVATVVNYITTNGNPAGQFIEGAADVDGVEGITITDAIAIVNMILSSGSSE